MRKDNKARSISLHYFKTYYKALVVETVWYWHKDRHVDKWNKIESPEVNSCINSQLISDKNSKSTKWVKDTLWENWSLTNKKILYLYFGHNMRSNWKRIKVLKNKTYNYKTSGRKYIEKLPDIGIGNDLSDVTPKAQITIEKKRSGTIS